MSNTDKNTDFEQGSLPAGLDAESQTKSEYPLPDKLMTEPVFELLPELPVRLHLASNQAKFSGPASAMNWQPLSPQYGHPFSIPEELIRIPTGSSVFEPDSVMDESGRTFHGYKSGGKYFLPNDAAEQDRLDLQHALMTMALDGRLACAPMTMAPKYVMDVATGTGIWALEFAEQNPNSYVIGTDLSKIQPERQFSNCEFIKEDSEEDWVFPNIPKFDYVHLRAVFTAFNQPKKVLANAVENLNPGGWIEYCDLDPRPRSADGSHEGTAVQKCWKLLCEGLAARGRDPLVTIKYKDWLHEAGLVDIVDTTYKLPGNSWPTDRKLKRIGRYVLTDLYNGMRGMCWQLFRGLGMEPAEIEELITRFKNESQDENIKIYYESHVVYGRKPLDGELATKAMSQETSTADTA